MKSILLIFLGAGIVLNSSAQILNQPGEVRTISYEQGKRGAPVADVRIKSKGLTEVRSTEDGKFILPVKAEGGNIFTFEDISRAGYEPIVPSREEFLTRKFAINPGAEVTIVLASNDELLTERRRIEQQIRREKEKKIAELETRLAILQQDSVKNKVEIEQKQVELQKFKEAYFSSDDLIRSEAKRLSEIDFQSIDSVQAIIVNLLKSGKNDEVAEIVSRQLSPEIWAMIKTDPVQVLNKKMLEQRKLELKQDSLLLELIANHLKNLSDGYDINNQNDSAAFYLKQRMKLDTINLDYMKEYADYIELKQGAYTEALDVYKHCVKLCKIRFGELSEEVAQCYHKMGNINNILVQYSKALDCYNQELTIIEKLYGSDNIRLAPIYYKIGGDYANLGDFSKGIEFLMKSISIRQKQLVQVPHDLAETFYAIGMVYFFMSDYQEALIQINKASDVLKAKSGQDEHLVEMIRAMKSRIETTMSPHIFTVKVSDGGEAYQQGLRGSYTILEFDDWQIGNKENLIQKFIIENDHQKQLVLVNKEGIIVYKSAMRKMGFIVDVQHLSMSEFGHLTGKYQKWRASGQK